MTPPDGEASTVTADALPTVQINGIVWDQEIVGNVVYAVGQFSSARPAGAAAGTNETPRSNILAYNLTTGELITSFAPTINAQVRQVAASPDGTRLYIVGDFTSVNGQTRNRVAAFDLPSGALSDFNPNVSGAASGVDATNSAVYITGSFWRVSGQDREGAAALTRAGALLPWAPVLGDRQGKVVLVSPDQSKVVLGGAFPTLNGSANPGYGLGMVDAQTGALLPFSTNGIVRDAGNDSAILSLKSDGESLYGSGYVFGDGGNLEGSFRADWASGNLVWVNDCHGDTYDVQPFGDALYQAGHSHYCGSLVDGFPQSDPDWNFYRALAVSKDVQRITPPSLNNGYAEFAGNPQPKLLHWFPAMNTGTVSGAYQGPWTVNGNSEYLVYGGEFTRVNDKGQQGLVRFAVPAKSTNQQGPQMWNADWMPTATNVAGGALRISWPSNWDRDSEYLKYEVLRDGVVVKTFDSLRSKKADWGVPAFGWVDSSVVSGTSYSYRVRATDQQGHAAMSGTVTATASGASTDSAYRAAVLKDSPRNYWPLGEASGATAYDWAGGSDMTLNGSYTRNQSGALADETGKTSTRFNGSNAYGASSEKIVAPQVFTIEAWVRTDANGGPGGKMVGFGNAQTGLSSNYDRHIYMEPNGRITFGVYPGSTQTITSSGSYNDAKWHYVVATLSDSGMSLYVDGVRVAQRTDVYSGQYYYGYWRVGGDSTWGGNTYFKGYLEDVAVYDSVLSPQSIAAHYTAAGRTAPGAVSPADVYGAAVFGLHPDLYWRMDETTGSLANDYSGNDQPGSYLGGSTRGVTGPLVGVDNPGVTFTGGQLVSKNSFVDPKTYSLEAWFKTTTTAGGKIIGFGSSSSTTNSGSTDRHVYMTNTGQLVYGTYPGTQVRLTTTASYNDGKWHQVVATQGPAGMRLYVDGVQAGSNTTTGAQSYTGYWHVGGDVTWGPGGNAFAGTVDEVAVYSVPITADDVALHYSLGTTGKAPNVVPTASFTSSVAKLALAVDASASTDPDGTIASYAWNWGDGTPDGTGVTATHTYAAGGNYTVTLTVTDNDGGSGTASAPVSAVANVAPTAAFATTPSDLKITADASGSLDADGTIASYAWNWGDGTADGAGKTASHTYATAGVYSVKLTVTDDDGATGVLVQDVTATDPPVTATYAQDAFGRTVASGLGSADLGGAWSLKQSAANYRVNGSVAEFVQPAGGSQRFAYLPSVSSSDTAVEVDVALPALPVGGSSYTTVHVRRVGSDEYKSQTIISPSGAVTVQLLRNDTVLSNVATGWTVAAGESIRLRTEAVGTSPTTLRVKAWKVGATVPTTWTASTTDSTAALQAAGDIGLGVYLGGASTNVPFVTRFDNLWAGSTATVPGPAPDPAPNTAPTAAFTSTVSVLTASVDASGSADADGTIASYAWNWGDGTAAGAGKTASHTYATAGTYTVTLTVTDNAGAPGSVTGAVTVSDVTPPAPVAFAQDAFGRTVASGLGSADLGGAWSLKQSAANYRVNGSVAEFVQPAGGSQRFAYLPSVSSSDTAVEVDVALPALPVGGSSYTTVHVRRVGSDEYKSQTIISPSGAVTVQLLRNDTVLSNVATGWTVAAGESIRLRTEAVGTSPTTLRVKAWKVGATVPTTWTASTTDSTAALQAAGDIGLGVYLGGASTNVPFVTRFDNLWAGPSVGGPQ
ncbi:PKD domain-containing protein [uncultured Microbacterium sp.]|uniref:PKD domain-containing protein n=1 Tax=uncultured Microbacterium sp. TaxID=191216 RepID=UPI002602EE5D|nr:PKD domain-containing protein [uncultured Microbacterium sp.]